MKYNFDKWLDGHYFVRGMDKGTIEYMQDAFNAGKNSIPVDEPVKPEIAEEKLRELFRNNSDCYADTWQFQNDGSVKEGAVTQAMTEDKFIEIVRKQFAV